MSLRLLVDNWPAALVIATMPLVIGYFSVPVYWIVQYAFIDSPSASLVFRTMEFYTLTNLILALSGKIPYLHVVLPYVSYFVNPINFI
jgi:hypothetical protein